VETSDVELVVGWRAGDVSCAALLFDRYRAGMHAVSVSLLGPGADADDIVQDAVLIALSRPAALRDPVAVGAWLKGISRNVCRQRLDRIGADGALVDGGAVDLGPGPEAVIDALATRAWVWTALDALSPPLRHAVVLRYFSEARSYEAMAAVLGVPVGTVRSRLSEARRILLASLRAVADTAHADHATMQRHRDALFSAIFSEYNSGRECATLRWALDPDAQLLTGTDGSGPVIRGRDQIVRDIETDLEAGVRLEVLDIIAGPDITVVEGAFANPADDPDHCPPLTTQVFLHRGSSILSVGLHHRADPPEAGLETVGR
jgi:RNA polymerase sigma factor (sigma-70 family)